MRNNALEELVGAQRVVVTAKRTRWLVIGHGAFGGVKIVDAEAESRLLKRD